MDCSLPGSSIHGIFQARVLEWSAIAFSTIYEWIKKLWYIYTTECFSAIKRNSCESALMRRMNLEPIIQSEVSQKEKYKHHILMHIYIYRIQKDGTDEFMCRAAMEKRT